jgi:hypothetical protein
MIRTMVFVCFFWVCSPIFAQHPLYSHVQTTIDKAVENNRSAKVNLRIAKRKLESKFTELFGDPEPGNEDLIHAKPGLDKWLWYERYIVCSYLVWPESTLPVPDKWRLCHEPLSDDGETFIELWEKRQPKCETLLEVRRHIIKAYKVLKFPFPFGDKEFPERYLRTPVSPAVFSRQLSLELVLLDDDKADKLLGPHYPVIRARKSCSSRSKKLNMAQFYTEKVRDDWYRYHREYFRAYFRSIHPKELPPYSRAQELQESLTKAGLKPFLDRWKKKIKEQEKKEAKEEGNH